jgi:hypothetical protein
LCDRSPLDCVGNSFAAVPETKLTLPRYGIAKVAFVVSDNTTLIDVAGPMQTFDQVQSP